MTKFWVREGFLCWEGSLIRDNDADIIQLMRDKWEVLLAYHLEHEGRVHEVASTSCAGCANLDKSEDCEDCVFFRLLECACDPPWDIYTTSTEQEHKIAGCEAMLALIAMAEEACKEKKNGE